jgi:hypothetical protein
LITKRIVKFTQIEGFGKKPPLLGVMKRPQDMGFGATNSLKDISVSAISFLMIILGVSPLNP